MKTAINLLPPVYRRQRLVRRRAIQWSVVLLASLSAIGVAAGYKGREYQHTRAAVRSRGPRGPARPEHAPRNHRHARKN